MLFRIYNLQHRHHFIKKIGKKSLQIDIYNGDLYGNFNLIYDHFDIWWVDANGKVPSIKLTNGRNNKIVYRFFENNADRKALSKNDIIVLKTARTRLPMLSI